MCTSTSPKHPVSTPASGASPELTQQCDVEPAGLVDDARNGGVGRVVGE
jgi:hypothetical protein